MNFLRFGLFVGFLVCIAGSLTADDTKAMANPYAEILDAWKAEIENLQHIRDRLAVAVGEDVPRLQKIYMQAVADGKSSLQNFTAAAEDELEQGGENKKQAANFLRERLGGLLDADDFERALRIGQLLMANGYDDRKVQEATGIAAGMTNHLQQAREYLEQADQKEPLSTIGRKLLTTLPEMEAAWKEEQQIRGAEQRADDLPRVRLSTSQGDVVVELFENEAPQTVGNFVELVDQKFYDGSDFHRVIPHRVAQGGCPNGDGTGGPGYSIHCECLGDDYRRHFRGSLSMARTADPHTGGSQFFFCMAPLSDLDGQYTVFGRIIEGMDVLAKLQRQDGKTKAPLPADRILKATVERKRDHEYRSTPYVPQLEREST